MASNSIYRGPFDRQPITVQRKVTAAYKPGSFVEDTGSALTHITTALAKRPLILGLQDYLGQAPSTDYVLGDTGVAYELEVGQVYQARMAAATYAYGAPLTIGASGRLTAAGSETVVVAFFVGAAGTLSADDLADVKIANFYTVPKAA